MRGKDRRHWTTREWWVASNRRSICFYHHRNSFVNILVQVLPHLPSQLQAARFGANVAVSWLARHVWAPNGGREGQSSASPYVNRISVNCETVVPARWRQSVYGVYRHRVRSTRLSQTTDLRWIAVMPLQESTKENIRKHLEDVSLHVSLYHDICASSGRLSLITSIVIVEPFLFLPYTFV